MHIAVISGYVLSSILAFCGLLSVLNFFSAGKPAEMEATVYLAGLSTAIWPLAAAVAVFTLVQIAILLEKLVIVGGVPHMSGGEGAALPPMPLPQPKQKVRKPAPVVDGGFFHVDPASVPGPEAQAPQEVQGAQEEELDIITSLAHEADSKRIAEEEQHPENLPDDSAPLEEQQEPKHERSQAEGLSFFRID